LYQKIQSDAAGLAKARQHPHQPIQLADSVTVYHGGHPKEHAMRFEHLQAPQGLRRLSP
jgi:hypothetical protein